MEDLSSAIKRMRAGPWRWMRRRLRAAFQIATDSRGRPFDDPPPLRAELFSADQLEQHGRRLADSHRLAAGRLPDPLLSRLAENEAVLSRTCRRLTTAVAARHRITPAAEWLLDNYYLIEEQIRTARRHLPKGYSRELPGLAEGASAGLPRVYDIALETIAHGAMQALLMLSPPPTGISEHDIRAGDPGELDAWNASFEWSWSHTPKGKLKPGS